MFCRGLSGPLISRKSCEPCTGLLSEAALTRELQELTSEQQDEFFPVQFQLYPHFIFSQLKHLHSNQSEWCYLNQSNCGLRELISIEVDQSEAMQVRKLLSWKSAPTLSLWSALPVFIWSYNRGSHLPEPLHPSCCNWTVSAELYHIELFSLKSPYFMAPRIWEFLMALNRWWKIFGWQRLF